MGAWTPDLWAEPSKRCSEALFQGITDVTALEAHWPRACRANASARISTSFAVGALLLAALGLYGLLAYLVALF